MIIFDQLQTDKPIFFNSLPNKTVSGFAPFSVEKRGSGSTTGIAANLLSRRFVGIDREESFLELSAKRKHEIECDKIRRSFLEKLNEIK